MPPPIGRLIQDDKGAHWRLSAEYCLEECDGFHGVVTVEQGKSRETFFTPGVWEDPMDAFSCSLAIFDQVAAAKDRHVEVERVM